MKQRKEGTEPQEAQKAHVHLVLLVVSSPLGQGWYTMMPSQKLQL